MATTQMVAYCFDVLNHKLDNPDKEYSTNPSFKNDSFPLFVTWYKKKQNSYSLRGCIGTFSETPLYEGLKEYAIYRFSPIQKTEVELLKCSINLLINFENGDDIHDWEIGTHGVRIHFVCPQTKKKFSSTYLPSVCQEQGWSKIECIESLIEKAGYKGKKKEVLKEIQLERYQSSVSNLTYQEYIDLKSKIYL